MQGCTQASLPRHTRRIGTTVRLAILAFLQDVPLITARDGRVGTFSPDLRQDSDRLLSLPAGPGMLREELEKVEKAAIETALREHRGEITATWQALGISRRALYERMKKYGLDKEGFR